MQLKFEDFCKDETNVYMADLVLGEGEYTVGHTHDFYEFLVVLEGSFIHYCNEEETKLTKGMCRFVIPEKFHRFCAMKSNPHSRLRNIALEKSYFEGLIKPVITRIQPILGQDLLLSTSLFEQYQYKTDKLLRFYEVTTAPYIIESVVRDLMLYMMYEGERNAKVPSWLAKAYKNMQEIQQLEGGLPRLLEECGKTQEHVTRAFKKYYGITPTDFINTERLNYSCKLLMTTKMSIIEIAYQCGFNTITYYNKRFKEKYGCTPTQYRNRNNKTFY